MDRARALARYKKFVDVRKHLKEERLAFEAEQAAKKVPPDRRLGARCPRGCHASRAAEGSGSRLLVAWAPCGM